MTRSAMHTGLAWDDQAYIRTYPQCHKRFEVLFVEDWAYRDKQRANRSGVKLLCSWTCLRAWERAHPAEPNRRQKTDKSERNLEVYRRFMAGKTSRELGHIYGVSGSTIIAWVEKARNISSEEEIANGTE